MAFELTISSTLAHDGDDFTRYGVEVATENFSASTLAWGCTNQHLELADALSGFPKRNDSRVAFQFGSAGTGCCELIFLCINGAGHTGVWASIEAPYPVHPTDQFESSRIFLRCEPAAIDCFISSLRAFVLGANNKATLVGRAP